MTAVAPSIASLPGRTVMALCKPHKIEVSGAMNIQSFLRKESFCKDDDPELQLIGTATTEHQAITVNLAFSPSAQYVCGAFLKKDERQGFADKKGGEVAMTIHVDHVWKANKTLLNTRHDHEREEPYETNDITS